MQIATKSLLTRYQRKLDKVERPAPDPRASVRDAYLQAAAVLDAFTFQSLKSQGQPEESKDSRGLIFDDCLPASGAAASQMFCLKLEPRRAALRALGTREAMRAALRANPDHQTTPLQTAWQNYLETGTLPKLDALSYRDLALVCQILSWLDGLDPSLPSLDLAQDWLRRRSVLASFEHLVVDNFTGRSAELAMLREHIGALPPVQGVEAAWRQLREWLGPNERPILAIHGVGGIGKSALIGRLLWEHAISEQEVRLPFAYLAFDRPSLRIDATFTILSEIAGQLELQFPELAQAFDRFRKSVIDFRDARGALVSRSLNRATRGARTQSYLDADGALHVAFVLLLRTVGARTVDGKKVEAPIVVVFDTFEEVQYRDLESLRPFWRMLESLRVGYPKLRIIVCGRAAVTAAGSLPAALREVSLPELTMPDRVDLLMRLGVADHELAQAVAAQVGGNPLTLRLAARVLEAEPQTTSDRGIDSLVTRRLLFFKLNEQLVQGQLYRRVLDHIHDPNVRRLAHPGMVLRRIDPEVILHVLAPICLPEVRDIAAAAAIFQELRKESSLVTVDAADGAVVYRPDIRRSLLHLLQQDSFEEVRRLRQRAVNYYAGFGDPVSRGEELYHRLVLGNDDRQALDERWADEAQAAVASGLDEYSDEMKAWLASRMSLEVPRSVYANADTAEWERNIVRKVQTALSEADGIDALALLSERLERTPASPLYAMEAKAHMHIGTAPHRKAAGEVLDAGIGALAVSFNRGRLAELLWLRSQVFLLGEPPDVSAADDCLARAQAAIERARNPIALIHVLGQRLLLRSYHTLESQSNRQQVLQRQLASACERIDREQAYGETVVVSLAAAMLERNIYPAAWHHLEPILGRSVAQITPELLTGENLQGLDEYRDSWELTPDFASPQAAI